MKNEFYKHDTRVMSPEELKEKYKEELDLFEY